MMRIRPWRRTTPRLAAATALVALGLVGATGTPPAAAGGQPADNTCAIRSDGVVKCWGTSSLGQLGQGDTTKRGDGPGEMGDNLPPIDLGTGRTATAITAGGAHTCALLDNDQVKCWGYNLSGQLGLGDTTNRGDGAGEMGDNLPPIDLGTGRTATAIFARPRTTCAHLDDGTLKCWGDGSLGQLGQGDTTNRGDGPGEMGDNLPPIDLGTVTPVGDPVCQGQTVTVDLAHGDQPTPGDDVILGTPGDDTIQARRGDDLVCGLGGVDTIGGGGGTDRIFGGGGNDILRSGPSGGLIAGGAGNDTITGAAGKDTLRGGPDDDTITGAAGNDLGDGGPGTDTCTLAPGNDTTRNCEA